MHARIFLHASTFTPGPIHSNPLPHCFKFGEKLYFPWQRHIWRKRRPDKEPILKGVLRSNISCQSEVFPGWRQAYISSKCHFSPRTRCSFYLWIANNPSSPTIFSQWFLPVVFQFIWHVEKKNHFNCNRWIGVQLMHLWSWQYIFFPADDQCLSEYPWFGSAWLWGIPFIPYTGLRHSQWPIW